MPLSQHDQRYVAPCCPVPWAKNSDWTTMSSKLATANSPAAWAMTSAFTGRQASHAGTRLPARRHGFVVSQLPLPSSRDRAEDHPGAESQDDQVDEHLHGDHQPRRLGHGGDVAEPDGREHG